LHAKSGEAYDMVIILIEMTIENAVMQVVNLVNRLCLTDSLPTMKADGRWVIANKIFSRKID
jgi:hypothetical protein